MIFRAQLEEATREAWNLYRSEGYFDEQTDETKQRAMDMVQKALDTYASLPKRPRKAKT